MVTNTVYSIPKGWRLCVADDIKSPQPHSCVAGPFGSKISSKYFVDEGVPVIRGSNLRDDLTRFISDRFVFVSEAKAQEYRPQHVHGGDLVFTCWGTVGQVGLVPEDGPYPEYIISNKQLKLRIDLTVADPLFCFYYFASPRYAEYIRNRGIGGAVPGINLGILKSLPIALPPLQVQKRIADTLSAYDNLIENNRRRMELLEEAARQLYREWFLRLRFPGREHTRIINGLPQGWERCQIRDFGEVITGKTPSTKQEDNYGGEIPFIKTPDMHGNIFVVKTETQLTEKGGNGQLGKYVPPGTLLVSCIGTIGVVAITSAISQFNQQINAVVPFEECFRYYCLFAIKDLEPQLKAIGGGATMGNVNKKKFESLELVRPNLSLLRDFHDSCGPMFRQIHILALQNQKLRAARDLLLPRLMSGELAV